MTVENFDNVIGISCKKKKKQSRCKILGLTGWKEFPKYPYRDIWGLIPHVPEYGVIAEKEIDNIHIYKKTKIDYIFESNKDKTFEVIFEEPKRCTLALEKERGFFLTCPGYPYSKDDERLR